MAASKELLKQNQSIKPIIDAQKSRILLENLYKFKCFSVTQLDGYDDKNYKVVVHDANVTKEYVFKIMNSVDSKQPSVVEAQCAFMVHLRTNGIPCSMSFPNCMGQHYSVEELLSGEHIVRLLDFLPGHILHEVPPSPRLLFDVGKFAAKLDLAAKTFHHDGHIRYKSIWMLEEMPQIVKFTYTIEDISKRQIVKDVIKAFTDYVLPIKHELEKGTIHGDFNQHNIVAQCINGEWNITGILDFGDSHVSCYIFELAIAITYMMIYYKHLDAAGYVLAGYSTVRKPTDREFSLLKICVAARLCQSLVLNTYSSLQEPENVYLVVCVPTAWKLLFELWPMEEKVVLDRWKTLAETHVNHNKNNEI